MEQVWSQTYKSKDHLEQVSSLLTVMPRRRCPELIGCELPPACAELGGRPETVSLIDHLEVGDREHFIKYV